MARFRLGHHITPADPIAPEQQGLWRQQIGGEDYWLQDVRLTQPESGTVDTELSCSLCGTPVPIRVLSDGVIRRKARLARLMIIGQLIGLFGSVALIAAALEYFVGLDTLLQMVFGQNSLFIQNIAAPLLGLTFLAALLGGLIGIFQPANKLVLAARIRRADSGSHILIPPRGNGRPGFATRMLERVEERIVERATFERY